jgi:cytochrome bd-type quinol oxidase subunit 2
MNIYKRFMVLFFTFLPIFLSAQDIQFNADSVYSYIEHLSVTIGSRTMGTENERAALQWAEKKFTSFGADTSYILRYSKYDNMNTNSGVAVGVFNGKSDSAIVVGGHIDSDNFEIPGANDNASGCATAIELARLWGQRDRFYTMIFAAFGGEEQGLRGSRHFVSADPHIEDVALMISTDMTGSDDDIIIMFETDKAQSPSWLARDAFFIDHSLEINRLLYPVHFYSLNNVTPSGPGSDHIPFINHGIPAIDFSTGIENSPIHSQQDRIENIDIDMLGQSGLIVDNLIKLYQSQGIPAKNDDTYVLWKLFGEPFVFPLWLVVVFNLMALFSGVAAFIHTIKNRQKQDAVNPAKLSGLKLFLFLIIIAIVSQFGEGLMQIIKGFRYPWLLYVQQYLWLAAIWAVLGVWICLQIKKKWRFNPDPFNYAMRALIIIMVYLLVLFFLGARIAFYPALTLLLFSMAIILPWPSVKTILILITPLPAARLMFSEMFNAFPARMSTFMGTMLDSWIKSLIFSLFLTLLLILWYLPFVYTFTYSIYTLPRIKAVFKLMRKPQTLIIIAVLFIGYSGILYSLPVYNDRWKPHITVQAAYDMLTGESKLSLTGNDYFQGLSVKSDSLHKNYSGSIHKDILEQDFTAKWIGITGEEYLTKAAADTIRDTLQVDWQLFSLQPWQRVKLVFKMDTMSIADFESDLAFRLNNEKVEVLWYAEPPDTLHFKASFTVPPGSRLIRQLQATYTQLPITLKATSNIADVKYRTVVTYQDTIAFAKRSTE